MMRRTCGSNHNGRCLCMKCDPSIDGLHRASRKNAKDYSLRNSFLLRGLWRA